MIFCGFNFCGGMLQLVRIDLNSWVSGRNFIFFTKNRDFSLNWSCELRRLVVLTDRFHICDFVMRMRNYTHPGFVSHRRNLPTQSLSLCCWAKQTVAVFVSLITTREINSQGQELSCLLRPRFFLDVMKAGKVSEFCCTLVLSLSLPDRQMFSRGFGSFGNASANAA